MILLQKISINDIIMTDRHILLITIDNKVYNAETKCKSSKGFDTTAHIEDKVNEKAVILV